MIDQPRVIQVAIPAAASAVDLTAVVPEAGSEYEVVEVSESHTVAGTDGGAVTCDVVKCTGTQAPSAGTTLLSSTFNLKSTANTPVSKNRASGLVASAVTRTIKAGQRLCLNFTGTTTAYEGGLFTVVLARRRKGIYQ